MVILAGLILVQPFPVGYGQEVASLKAGDELPEVISEWLERLPIRRGVCVVLGKDGTIATQFASQSDFLVQVRHPQWYVVVLDMATSKLLSNVELPEPPLPGGLAIDREG